MRGLVERLRARAAAGFAVPLALVVVSLLSNPKAALGAGVYYFRDFSLTFYPQRAFFAKEVASGRWPFWNPYLYEGCAVLPFYYPVDLLHLLWPSARFVSWLLTLHLPLAALGAYWLARDLGATRAGAFVAGALYSLGGLCVSSLSLVIFLEALAWGPFVVLTLRRAAIGGTRAVAAGALTLGVAISTLAVEFVVQAALLGAGLALAARRDRLTVVRLSASLLLGLALAGVPVLLTIGIVAESVRGEGVTSFEALQRSVHPLTLFQAVVAGALGPPSEPFQFRFWGRLFTDGPPYFTSLFVGPLALVLCAAGFGALARVERVVLLSLASLALWYALGWHSGLAPLLVPWIRFFRFPVKALFLPYMIVCVLAGLGATRLARGHGRGAAARAAIGLGLAAGGLSALLLLAPQEAAAWLAIDEALARAALPLVGRSALMSAALCGCAVLALRYPGSLPRSVTLLSALAVVDVWRAGIGVNPQAPPGFYSLLPELQRELEGMGSARLFSYGGEVSPSMNDVLGSRRRGLHLQAFFLTRQLLSPFTNVLDGIAVAEGLDRHGFIPNPQLLKRHQRVPGAISEALPVLRNAAVGRIVSLDPLQDPGLRRRARVETGVPGVSVYVYEMSQPQPRDYVACRVWPERDPRRALERALEPDFALALGVVLEVDDGSNCTEGRVVERLQAPGHDRYVVELDGSGYFVMRDSFTASWRASVDGQPVRLLRANGHHRAVHLGPGRHELRLDYVPPLWREAVLSSLGAALAVGALFAAGGARNARTSS